MWMTGKTGKEEDHQILNKVAMFIFVPTWNHLHFHIYFCINVVTMQLTLVFTSGERVLSVVMNVAIGFKSTSEEVTWFALKNRVMLGGNLEMCCLSGQPPDPSRIIVMHVERERFLSGRFWLDQEENELKDTVLLT